MQQCSSIEISAICKHCSQSYPVPLVRAGNTTCDMVCNFCNCPHCDQRNDLWIYVKQPTIPKHKPEPEFVAYNYQERAGYNAGRARGWNECVDDTMPTAAQPQTEKQTV